MKSNKKIAVVLSGCGVYDGAEIHEATLALYSIMKNGCTYEIFAPDINQAHVINHITGVEMNESRNVLIESARIARGQIHSLSSFKADSFDAIIFPGGFGAAKNLSSFAFEGINMKVNPDVENAIVDSVNNKIPIGAMCISPVILAKVLESPELTIGQDEGTADAVKNLGANHISTDHGEVIIDKKYKIATTPCYMLDADILQIADGAENIVKAIINMID